MKYRVVDTTDHNYRGMILELDSIVVGMKIKLRDYVFEVDKIIEKDNEIKLVSYNYIIILKEV